MSNLTKYNQAFITVFGIGDEDLLTLEYQQIECWDSVGHMQLIAELENTFDIMFDTDDIIDFSSYQKGLLLIRKYDIQL